MEVLDPDLAKLTGLIDCFQICFELGPPHIGIHASSKPPILLRRMGKLSVQFEQCLASLLLRKSMQFHSTCLFHRKFNLHNGYAIVAGGSVV